MPFKILSRGITESHSPTSYGLLDQGSEFYNRTFDKWLGDNKIERYSTYNEGKAVVIERFYRTLKCGVTLVLTIQMFTLTCYRN